MTKLPEPLRTVGDVLPTFGAPLWHRERTARRGHGQPWHDFWWALGVAGALGVWGGWLAAQVYPICGP